jgi:hypothetical protein
MMWETPSYELAKIQKTAVLAYFKVFFWYSSGGTEESGKKICWCPWHKIRIGHRPDTNQSGYCMSQVALCSVLRVVRPKFDYRQGKVKLSLWLTKHHAMKTYWMDGGVGPCMRVYPKVSGLATWSENCKWCSSLPLSAVVSLFCGSV